MHMSIEAFADRVNDIMPAVFKEFAKRLTRELHKTKITLMQFFVLEFLNREGESKMTELAHFTNVTTAAMTGIVDRLVRDGYVERVYDNNDRRIVKVKLTQSGCSVANKICERRRHMVVKVFAKISEEERRQYLNILSHIRDILASGDI